MRGTGVPYALGGAYSHYAFTGVWRDSKDLDAFVRPQDVRTVLDAFAEAGFDTEVRDPHWLAKVHSAPHLFDILFAVRHMTRLRITDEWLETSLAARFLGVPTRMLGPEETIATKVVHRQPGPVRRRGHPAHHPRPPGRGRLAAADRPARRRRGDRALAPRPLRVRVPHAPGVAAARAHASGRSSAFRRRPPCSAPAPSAAWSSTPRRSRGRRRVGLPGRRGAPPDPRPRGEAPVRVAALADLHCGVDGSARDEPHPRGRAGRGRSASCSAATSPTWAFWRRERPCWRRSPAVRLPVVAVLGNHDHESGQAEALAGLLRDGGVHAAGRHRLGAGRRRLRRRQGLRRRLHASPAHRRSARPAIKHFVDVVRAARPPPSTTRSPISARGSRVAVLHYSPIASTLAGEPLGDLPLSRRLAARRGDRPPRRRRGRPRTRARRHVRGRHRGRHPRAQRVTPGAEPQARRAGRPTSRSTSRRRADLAAGGAVSAARRRHAPRAAAHRRRRASGRGPPRTPSSPEGTSAACSCRRRRR